MVFSIGVDTPKPGFNYPIALFLYIIIKVIYYDTGKNKCWVRHWSDLFS